MSKQPVSAVRSYDRGCVTVKIEASVRDRGANIKAQTSVDIPIAEARQLALELNALADEADAKAAKERAHQERRAKWREREIAAGRIRTMTPREFFG